ncbi:fructose-bisphosphate aldolase [candidate division LCP-89 bacterium B3_LCP]|uniref:Fructose-bisphosphate aldolase n=1 Tax=candidate division LCP-89 bacterium B3_LCP TaxID=2012998 RepID=A0A532V3V3_UNCL8|nr:MAG: fructose-bisphosphate aldolase [candidate division LCP-89 bacterium B3_LCP]
MPSLLDLRPDYIKNKLGENSNICLIGSHPIISALRDDNVMVMACNTRIKLVIPGIMRAAEELDAIIGFELAKTEGHIDGGYTGQTPQIYFDTIVGYADQINFSKPFFIHGDHITVKDTSEEEIQSSEALIKTELEAGYTSFAIDASFNELNDNISITTRLAKALSDMQIGLEVEVGEVKSTGQEAEITTIEEATTFIDGLKSNGLNPDLLAINNGSKHGNYKPGEEVHIDLQRTGDIFRAIKGHGVCIAQHGITGTPLHMMGKFTEYGIRKGNVGTLWQNIAHAHLPEDLMTEIKKWVEDNKSDIKKATKPFKERIDSIGESYRREIEEHAYREACEHIKAFRAVGSASLLKEKVR